MMDERRLYIGQLLRNYKQNGFDLSGFVVNYRFDDDKEDRFKVFSYNEGIEHAIDYIRELEKKIDKLQDIERIIKVARRGDYGNYSL
jgi:hypothetical protein